MLHDNHASHAVARIWCREFAESAVEAPFVSTLTRKPSSLAGIEVRNVDVQEYEEFAHKQNTFYRQYNLYPPSSPNSIAGALSVSVERRKPYRYIATVDRHGNLLAGAQTWVRGALKSDTINHLPPLIRLLNRVVHVLPADLTIRDVAVIGPWYEPGQSKMGQYWWQMLRWLCRDQGTILAASFDSRDPAMHVMALKPWQQPRPKITLAMHGPTPIHRDQLLFAKGRM